jgi:hypothetical protein
MLTCSVKVSKQKHFMFNSVYVSQEYLLEDLLEDDIVSIYLLNFLCFLLGIFIYLFGRSFR